MKAKIDSVHVVLVLVAALFATLLWQQVARTEAARADAERYKRFSVWSLDHADAQFAAYVKQASSNQRELEKYVDDDARQKLRDGGFLSTVPPLPDSEKIAEPFEGSVDLRTFEEIQTLRHKAK